VRINTPTGHGTALPSTAILENVLHVPEATETNLMSLHQLIVRGFTATLTRTNAVLYKDGVLRAVAKKTDRMWTLTSGFASKEVEKACLAIGFGRELVELWHRRLGHLDIQAVLKLANRDMAVGIPELRTTTVKERCQDCLVGRMVRKPFKPTERRTTKPLELVHSDLCGPMKTASIGESRYFMLLIDDFSRYTAVFFLKKKSDAAEAFEQYKAAAERKQSGPGKGYKIQARDIRSRQSGPMVEGSTAAMSS
jgi:hypothetical protein